MALTDNLVAFWRLEEASGTRNDSFGTNHLTDVNTVGSATGKIGTGASFVAANSEYLTIADNAAVSMGDIDFTFACWMQFSVAGLSHRIISKLHGTAHEFTVIKDTLDILHFYVYPSGSYVSSTALAAGVWHHVVVWHDAGLNTINMQINNGVVVSTAVTTGVNDSDSSFTIGGDIVGNYMNGLIDEVGIWKRVLTATERTQLYNSGAGERFTWLTLAAYWKLDEASGIRTDSFGTSHLTDINTVGSTTGKIGTAGQFVAASSERLQVADNAALSIGASSYTVAAWAYFDTVTGSNKIIASKQSAAVATSEFAFYYEPGISSLHWRVYSASGHDTSFGPAVSAGVWYFIVGWWDNAAQTVNLQLNNGAVASRSFPNTVNDTTTAFCIGGTTPGWDSFDGRLDEVGLWRRVLTAGERTDLWNGGAGITYTPPVTTKPYYYARRRRVAA